MTMPEGGNHVEPQHRELFASQSIPVKARYVRPPYVDGTTT
jgi:hypothetical protein